MSDATDRVAAVISTCPVCREALPVTFLLQVQLKPADMLIAEPQPACVTLCAYCRVFLIFTRDVMRTLSNAEWAALPVDQREWLTKARDGLGSQR